MLPRYHQNVLNTSCQFCWKLVTWHIHRKPWASRLRIRRPDLDHQTFRKRFASLTRNWSCDISIESPGWVGDESDDPNSITKTAQIRYAAPPYSQAGEGRDPRPIPKRWKGRYTGISTLFSGCARGPCCRWHFILIVYFHPKCKNCLRSLIAERKGMKGWI